jgi:hypothetical protein
VPYFFRRTSRFIPGFFIILCVAFAVRPGFTSAATLQLSWVDNSSDEAGFSIERKVGTNGIYTVIATVGANVTTYKDINLTDGTTYCYRVNAFNSAGSSPYSPEACGATPSPSPSPPGQQFTLTINLVKQITTKGTGNGKVTSSPAGINCGSTCSATFNSGTVVTLTATPSSGSIFAGWSGTGCTSGSITLNADATCTATFSPQSGSLFTLAISNAGTGTGTVTSSPAGLNCGTTCSASFNRGTVVALVATPAAGSTFTGWSGSGCTSGSITLTSSTNCTANFTATPSVPTKIGVFRPSTGEWFLDRSGNGQWDGCGVDTCISPNPLGRPDDLPVVGSWSGNGASNIGTFNAATGSWYLDTNGNGAWDGCGVDTCVNGFGQPGDLPVTRKISGLNGSIIGTFAPRTVTIVKGRKKVQQGFWNFDLNGNSNFDGCSADKCDTFGKMNMLPVVGDWNGTGQEEIGVFLSNKGLWYLDSNGNGILDNCRLDACLKKFGISGDIPVVGDWDGTGKVRIGVFRPSTAQWLLDTNGNGKFDGCTVDTCLGPFGQPGDLPVVGKW